MDLDTAGQLTVQVRIWPEPEDRKQRRYVSDKLDPDLEN
jgi:hypothetical protein